MPEPLGIKLSLCVASVGVEPEFWVCSRHRCKLEGTCTFCWVGVCVFLVPVEVLVMEGVCRDVASTVILGSSEHLGFRLFLGVVGVDERLVYVESLDDKVNITCFSFVLIQCLLWTW